MITNHHEHYLKYKEYQTKYRRSHREKMRMGSTKYEHKRRLEVITLLGGKCVRCGFDDPRALQIDHVGGGGVKDKKLRTKGWSKLVIERVSDGSKKYQLLCANCNWIKRCENKEACGRPYVYD